MLLVSSLTAILNLIVATIAGAYAVAVPDNRWFSFPAALLSFNFAIAWLIVAGFHESTEATRRWSSAPAKLILGLAAVAIGGFFGANRI